MVGKGGDMPLEEMAGGEGGYSKIRFTMERNVEYVSDWIILCSKCTIPL